MQEGRNLGAYCVLEEQASQSLVIVSHGNYDYITNSIKIDQLFYMFSPTYDLYFKLLFFASRVFSCSYFQKAITRKLG